MIGLPPKISGFTVMRLRSVSSITVISSFRLRSSEEFIRYDIVDSKMLLFHRSGEGGAVHPDYLIAPVHNRGPRLYYQLGVGLVFHRSTDLAGELSVDAEFRVGWDV